MLVVLGELEIVALAVHPDRDSANPIPGIQVAPEGPEGTVIGGHGAASESDGCTEDLATWVEHGLLRTYFFLWRVIARGIPPPPPEGPPPSVDPRISIQSPRS